MNTARENTAVEFRNVDILFSGKSRRGAALKQAALAALDAGKSRAQISEQTGVVVGVAGANLSVAPGEISVLMGLSGSGKSTLLRAANGLNEVTRGQVLIKDGDAVVDIAKCDAATLRRVRRLRIAMVFQQFGLLPWRSVRDNVGFGLELRGEPTATRKRIIDEQLELVGLSQWAERHVGELSGGMQQRVGLARAFATNADVLLMDEPFSALDPLIRGKLQDELLALQARVKKTILFVSHDLDEALKLGDHITILEGGRIVQTGTAEDIVVRPASDYVAEFVTHMNPLSVLTGAMVMRRGTTVSGQDQTVWIDDEHRFQVLIDESGWPTSLTVDGTEQPLGHIGEDESWSPDRSGIAVAPASSSLSALIKLRNATGHPVLLVDEGRLLGSCCQKEIIQALAGKRFEN
ncbi:MAG: glycine betaine/proline transport system ATP-binding protein [Gammaproteobacteria bacterium]|jgi:glycine betaine/proline transport system ATP-binding protein|nr:glycine betaine/proline transport system ATP-binding protein [Gammaproteobacteria bacterium]